MSDDKPMVFLGTPDDKALIARLRAQDIALYHEAAAAIERLRKELAEWKQAAGVEARLRREFYDEIKRLTRFSGGNNRVG